MDTDKNNKNHEDITTKTDGNKENGRSSRDNDDINEKKARIAIISTKLIHPTN